MRALHLLPRYKTAEEKEKKKEKAERKIDVIIIKILKD